MIIINVKTETAINVTNKFAKPSKNPVDYLFDLIKNIIKINIINMIKPAIKY